MEPARRVAVFGADGLGGVFDDHEAVAAGDLQDGIHVGALPVEMHGNDRLGVGGDLGLDLANVEVEGSGQISTKTGLAPTRAMLPAVAKKV